MRVTHLTEHCLGLVFHFAAWNETTCPAATFWKHPLSLVRTSRFAQERLRASITKYNCPMTLPPLLWKARLKIVLLVIPIALSGALARGDGFTTLTPPPGYFVFPEAFSSMGQIAGGISKLPSGNPDGFIYSNGSYSVFPLPASLSDQFVTITGLNDEGEIVGYYNSNDGLRHGFVRSPQGNFTFFDMPGSVQTSIQGVNDAGEFVGWYQAAGPPVVYGFSDSAGKISVLRVTNNPVYSNPLTMALGINNEGQIVGFSDQETIFLDTNGKIQTAAPATSHSRIQVMTPTMQWLLTTTVRLRHGRLVPFPPISPWRLQ